MCINNATDTLLSNVTDAKSKFEVCKSILPLIPNVTLAIDQLKALQADIANSTADPACLAPIQAQITGVLNVVDLSKVNVFELTPEKIIFVTNGLQNLTTTLRANFSECIPAQTGPVIVSKYPLPNYCGEF